MSIFIKGSIVPFLKTTILGSIHTYLGTILGEFNLMQKHETVKPQTGKPKQF